MKVSDCRKCRYKREHRWSTHYEPRYYHAIGMTHVYAWCERWKKRCSEVKAVECRPGQMMLFDAEEGK